MLLQSFIKYLQAFRFLCSIYAIIEGNFGGDLLNEI